MSRRAPPLTDLDEIKLPAVQLAAILGITENELTKLARRGEVPREPNPEYPREWVYPLAAAVTAYCQYQRKDQAKSAEGIPGSPDTGTTGHGPEKRTGDRGQERHPD
jgi:hypothetical protein